MAGHRGDGAPRETLPVRSADKRQYHLDDRIARTDLPGRHRFDNEAPLSNVAGRRRGFGHDPISRRSSSIALIEINKDTEILVDLHRATPGFMLNS